MPQSRYVASPLLRTIHGTEPSSFEGPLPDAMHIWFTQQVLMAMIDGIQNKTTPGAALEKQIDGASAFHRLHDWNGLVWSFRSQATHGEIDGKLRFPKSR